MLKEAQGFSTPTNENKRFRRRAAAVERAGGALGIITEWERCGRTWGNPLCPCFHADPVLPDRRRGRNRGSEGRLWVAGGVDPLE
jgi:hypothetical protein